ncbi:MAG: 50S ribosomal protein L1 [Armatimonadetes bacterium]|nr:50S ribosomal protein L1 [Armatimonadota bacterium]
MPVKNKRKQPHSNRFISAAQHVEADKLYSVVEAIEKVQAAASTKFVESIDVSIKLGIDPKKSDQNVRGTTNIPHGTGKKKTVAVLAKGDHVKEAEDAGADFVGSDDLITKIQGGFKEFDVILATEEMAPQIGKIGKALGPKTPNKRNGTVTNQIGNAVKEIKAATRIEYRADKGGVVSVPLGKVNFTSAQIQENFKAAVHAVIKAKPSSTKGKYLVSCTLSSTMGPGFPLDVSDVTKFSE